MGDCGGRWSYLDEGVYRQIGLADFNMWSDTSRLFDDGHSQPSDRRARLKLATAASHTHLDKQIIASGFFATEERFAVYLQRMHAFYRAFESAALSVDAKLWKSLELDSHVTWLEADMACLGAPKIKCAPKAASPLRIEDASSLAGALYVISGSSLGARGLHRLTVERRLVGLGGSQYLGNLSRSQLWPKFLVHLGSARITDEAAMIEAAISTFDAVKTHLVAEVEDVCGC